MKPIYFLISSDATRERRKRDSDKGREKGSSRGELAHATSVPSAFAIRLQARHSLLARRFNVTARYATYYASRKPWVLKSQWARILRAARLLAREPGNTMRANSTD